MNSSTRLIRTVVLLVLGLYLVAGTIGLLIYALIPPSRSWIELVKASVELSLWLALPVLIVVLVLRAWRLMVLAAALSFAFVFIYGPYLLPRTVDVDADQPLLTVMTFNLKTTSEGIDEVIRSANADIVALQELSQTAADALTQLEDMYPHQALHAQADANEGQGILSRYPIVADEYWEYPNLPHTLGHQRVELDFNDTLILIYNTHPWPPLAWETGYNDESHRVVVRDIASRTLTVEQPLILVGDFNMTPIFAEYELLASGLTDSYRVAGDGIGYTFPNQKYRPLPPILRLDYIWHNQHFESVEAVVWPEHGQSDHSPVRATLVMSLS